MTFNDKIDEWIKEAETRPASALLILKLVANRLRDLTERNEQLLAENIALQNGTRVQEYQKRIAHLERQLDILKRRISEENFPGNSPTDAWEMAAQPDEPHAGERLAALMPLSRLPLADFFLQASRRGFVKKTLTSLAQSILDNHYLGRGDHPKI